MLEDAGSIDVENSFMSCSGCHWATVRRKMEPTHHEIEIVSLRSSTYLALELPVFQDPVGSSSRAAPIDGGLVIL